MKKINIKNIDLNESFFHFTSRDNLESISEYGLKAQIGEATKIVNGGARVYLSKGAKGVLGINDSFLRKFKETKICDIPNGYRKYFTDILDFSSEKIPDEKQVYEAFERKMKAEVYLFVDAKEGEDFLQEENTHWGNQFNTYGIENHDIVPQKLRLLTTEKGDTAFDIVDYLYNRLIAVAREKGQQIELTVREHLSSIDEMFEYINQKEEPSTDDGER